MRSFISSVILQIQISRSSLGDRKGLSRLGRSIRFLIRTRSRANMNRGFVGPLLTGNYPGGMISSLRTGLVRCVVATLGLSSVLSAAGAARPLDPAGSVCAGSQAFLAVSSSSSANEP